MPSLYSAAAERKTIHRRPGRRHQAADSSPDVAELPGAVAIATAAEIPPAAAATSIEQVSTPSRSGVKPTKPARKPRKKRKPLVCYCRPGGPVCVNCWAHGSPPRRPYFPPDRNLRPLRAPKIERT